MLTTIEKKKICEMRIDGANIYDIASEMNCSHQYIQEMLESLATRKMRQMRCIIYPNIKDWMIEHEVNGKAFARKLDVPEYKIYSVLSGKQELTDDFVIQIKTLTGLSNEEIKLKDPELSVSNRPPLANVKYPKIKEVLLNNNDTVANMARHIGLPYNTVYTACSNNKCNGEFYTDTQKKIAEYLGVPVDIAFLKGGK